MSIGDYERKIRKENLNKEIKNLKNQIRGIFNNDGDATENDEDIKAYKKIIKEKELELENL